ncbi:MAG: HEAT repeat domain-containing protein, partial [Planctomycetes bacterium]|nr:HEAT repeat domain-containing protein [Planctomycetota bacterium]
APSPETPPSGQIQEPPAQPIEETPARPEPDAGPARETPSAVPEPTAADPDAPSPPADAPSSDDVPGDTSPAASPPAADTGAAEPPAQEPKADEPDAAAAAPPVDDAPPPADPEKVLAPLELRHFRILQKQARSLSPQETRVADAYLRQLASLMNNPQSSPDVRISLVGRLAAYRSPLVSRAMQPFINDRDQSVRLAVVETICRQDNLEAAKILASLVISKDRVLASAGEITLSWLNDADAVEWLYSKVLPNRTNAKTAAAAANALLEIGDERSVPYVVKALDSPHDKVRVACAKTLGHYRVADAVPDLARHLSDSDPAVKAACLLALASIRDDSCAADVAKCLADKNISVRSAAARALAAFRRPEYVQDLIDALGREQTWAVEEITRALMLITGETLEGADDWHSWWQKRSAGFAPPPLDQAAAVVERRRVMTAEYYGVPIHSKRLIFVADISGSMQGPKIEEAKQQLTDAIKKFTPRTSFNIIFFSSTIRPWKNTLQSASPNNVKLAFDFIDNSFASGLTNIHDALAEALKDRYVDTIFLLSDGAATAGTVQAPDLIIESVSRVNRHRGVVIHCIGIGDHDRFFLQKLAEENNGRYVTPHGLPAAAPGALK